VQNFCPAHQTGATRDPAILYNLTLIGDIPEDPTILIDDVLTSKRYPSVQIRFWQSVPIRIGFHDSAENLHDRCPIERWFPNEHFIQNAAEWPHASPPAAGVADCRLAGYGSA